jgi:amino acid permease
MLAVSCVVTLYCAKLLLETRKKLGANSYTEIGEMTYGTWGRVSVDIALVLS